MQEKNRQGIDFKISWILFQVGTKAAYSSPGYNKGLLAQKNNIILKL